jgi:O-antigen ligase
VHQPFGAGPGTAGPASEHNNHPARIAENYFLQVGQEAGWLGLGLFIAIVVLIGKSFWDRRIEPNQLVIVMLSSLVGLIVVNLLLPAWTDDTLAYVWWGLAGITAASTAVTTQKTGKLSKKKGNA